MGMLLNGSLGLNSTSNWKKKAEKERHDTAETYTEADNK